MSGAGFLVARLIARPGPNRAASRLIHDTQSGRLSSARALSLLSYSRPLFSPAGIIAPLIYRPGRKKGKEQSVVYVYDRPADITGRNFAAAVTNHHSLARNSFRLFVWFSFSFSIFMPKCAFIARLRMRLSDVKFTALAAVF